VLTVESGKDPNVTVPAGIFQSFGDAPGGTAEEFREKVLALFAEEFLQDEVSKRQNILQIHFDNEKNCKTLTDILTLL